MILEQLANFKFPHFNFSPEEIEKKCRSTLIIVAITAITYLSVGIFYDILSVKLLKTGVPKASKENDTVIPSLAKPSADMYTLIPQRNLFGSTDKSAFGKNTDIAGLPDKPQRTELSTVLDIKGTVAGSGKDGFAVIEEKGKNKQMLYKVGNTVAGAKLLRIIRNAVAFEVDGKEVVLKMAETKEAPIIPPRTAAQQPIVSPGKSAPTTLNLNEVNAALKDMGAMLSQAQIRPYYSAGVPDGFMVSNIKPGSIFEKIGLAEGDIIQGTDDRKLQTADDMTALYNSFKNGSSFTLRIKRGGQQENFQYVFR